MMTLHEIAEAEARANAATPGPECEPDEFALMTPEEIYAAMESEAWIWCLPRLQFNRDGTVDIALLEESLTNFYRPFWPFWEKEFPVAELTSGIREAYRAAVNHAKKRMNDDGPTRDY